MMRELLDGLREVRDSGEVNMLDINNVQRVAAKLKLTNVVLWIESDVRISSRRFNFEKYMETLEGV